ncbi:hypothetical protein [Actinomadura macrotermitis]|uniref:Matrixin n=1 Tax=Actinomadura macrotermitis TaxID=2585200 RepID=A0A7K0BR58_9ACTN|nr:hypothetical protein [Actinomadura macrotermitis]MQY03673.1 hypothetical protein [Actinomadura macrotermitis]
MSKHPGITAGRFRHRAAPAAVVAGLILAAAAAPEAAAAASRAPWCGTGPVLQADAMPRRVTPAQCRLAGRTLRSAAGASAVAPTDGTTVTAHLLRPDGAAELRISPDPETGGYTVSHDFAGLTPPTGDRAAPLDPCTDTEHKVSPTAWPKGATIKWRYYAGTAKNGGLGLRHPFRAISRGIVNAVNAHTDCNQPDGLGPKPNIFEHFDGDTDKAPNIGDEGTCRQRDSVNSFGWKRAAGLQTFILGMTCTWEIDHRTVEGDTALPDQPGMWWEPGDDRRGARAPLPGCPPNHYIPSAVATHEALHVLGLEHVEGARHAALTMTPALASCDDGAATLGKGDYDGLIELYGPRP